MYMEEKKLKLVEKIEGDSVEYSDAEEEVTEAVWWRLWNDSEYT